MELKDIISIIINILLLLVTLATVRYASKTLLMEYSSQVLVSNYRKKLTCSYYPYLWEVEVENVGKGYVVKAFILLSVPSKRFSKEYYLSKPIVGLEAKEKRKIALTLKEEHAKNEKDIFKTAKLEVLYQDSLNNMYVVTPGSDEANKHLETFNELPIKMNKAKRRKYNEKIKLAAKQGNTYTKMFEQEIELDRKRLLEKIEIQKRDKQR